jgi:hypothetical protein
MNGTNIKHVQTELTEDEYETFREMTNELDMTIKEAGHEALVRWIEHQHNVDPTDRAFTVLDELDTVSLPPMAATDARQEPDIVDGWRGSDVSFTLTENPSEHRE